MTFTHLSPHFHFTTSLVEANITPSNSATSPYPTSSRVKATLCLKERAFFHLVLLNSFDDVLFGIVCVGDVIKLCERCDGNAHPATQIAQDSTIVFGILQVKRIQH